MRRVLDAWPVLKWLKGTDPPATALQSMLDRADAGAVELYMSMVNVGEVFYIIAKRHGRAEASTFLERVLPGMPIQILVPDRHLILEAARWKAGARISYADGFALATAVSLRARLVTGDPEMKHLDRRVIEWIGA